jgi:hypothetical protein
VQSTTGFVVAQLTAIHFQKVTSCLQHLRDAMEDSARGFFGESKRGQTMGIGCIPTGLVEFALQILLSDGDVAQGHADIFMAEQPHERGETDSQPEHLGRESVSKHVRCHTAGAAGTLRGLS